MSTTQSEQVPDLSALKQRRPNDSDTTRHTEDPEAAKATTENLNKQEQLSNKSPDQKRTFGRTPDGTVFTVPQTHDMVSQLLSPTQPKTIADLFVVTVLASLFSILFLLPTSVTVPLFAIIYTFWRTAYNAGIGWLLWQQSHCGLLVYWAQKSTLFEDPATGRNKHTAIFKWLKRDMELMIPQNFVFEKAPLEYNTWLVFRRVVDLILMSDFISYVCFAIACSKTPTGETLLGTFLRWFGGISLVLFNLWVKLDAHRVVKDYAWYWGDFFFLIDQELTFDGVFEMAPHPMYSVGYAGYYGISLMAGSYKVLAISIAAHAAQFAFLALVENPHIEKTYNPPMPRKRGQSETQQDRSDDQSAGLDGVEDIVLPSSHDLPSESSATASLTPAEPPKSLSGVYNVDFHRVIDCSTVLIQVYFYTLAIVSPSTLPYQAFFVINAIVWRLWYSLGIGYILDRQSKKKNWTRHFIKYGETSEEAWRQWKGVYHLSMIMCYVSFVTAAGKMYSLPPDWSYSMATIRHVVGAALIALQLWTVFSIYESLGEFGWFFGDFFFDRKNKLTYSGIYRFLNNPERVIGLAGVWGFALITWSKSVFFLALLSHILTLAFIQLVERPHMQRRYGQRLRVDSGLSKSFKRSLPASLQVWQGSVDRIIEDTADMVEEFIEATAPKFAAGVDTLVRDTKSLLSRYPRGVASAVRASPDMAGVDKSAYSIEFQGTRASAATTVDKSSGREGEMAQKPTFEGHELRPIVLEYGAPIKVKWTAPITHGRKDWIGLYMLADNTSQRVTRISSQGRWISCCKGEYDARAQQGLLVAAHRSVSDRVRVTGEMEFAGDKLWWTTGVFEFRYHHDGTHAVMASSRPFEVSIARFDDGFEDTGDVSDLNSTAMRTRVEAMLLPIVRDCFDRDPDIAPNTSDEAFGGMVEREGKFARRVVFALRQMFGIEFAPAVVKADGNIRNLAWRICNARAVLAPYAMSAGSRGTVTPAGD